MAKGKKSRGKKNRNQTGPSTAVGPESTPTVPESAILGQQGSNGGDSVLGGTMSMLSDDDIAKLTQVSPPQSSGLMGATVHSAGAMGPPPLPPSTRASAINAVGHIESPSHSIPGLLGTADPPASAQSGLVRQLNNLSLEEKKRVLKAFRQLDGRELPEAVQNARSVTTSETTSGQTSATSGKTSSTTEVRECEVMASLDEIQEHLARLSLEEKEEEPEAAPVPQHSATSPDKAVSVAGLPEAPAEEGHPLPEEGDSVPCTHAACTAFAERMERYHGLHPAKPSTADRVWPPDTTLADCELLEGQLKVLADMGASLERQIPVRASEHESVPGVAGGPAPPLVTDAISLVLDMYKKRPRKGGKVFNSRCFRIVAERGQLLSSAEIMMVHDEIKAVMYIHERMQQMRNYVLMLVGQIKDLRRHGIHIDWLDSDLSRLCEQLPASMRKHLNTSFGENRRDELVGRHTPSNSADAPTLVSAYFNSWRLEKAIQTWFNLRWRMELYEARARNLERFVFGKVIRLDPDNKYVRQPAPPPSSVGRNHQGGKLIAPSPTLAASEQHRKTFAPDFVDKTGAQAHADVRYLTDLASIMQEDIKWLETGSGSAATLWGSPAGEWLRSRHKGINVTARGKTHLKLEERELLERVGGPFEIWLAERAHCFHKYLAKWDAKPAAIAAYAV